jgi:HEAT repeat protein
VPSADRRAVVLAGHTGDLDVARAGLTHTDADVRAAALGALARAGALDATALGAALTDGHPAVRRRAAEEAARLVTVAVDLVPLTHDDDPTVVEAAAHALGELDPAPPGAVEALVRLAQHGEVVIRETAVAALGSRGEGLATVLRATEDVATVRRRAVLALAAFEGEAVEQALARLAKDRDRQVRQAAEDLLHGWGG